jgi:aryl-alcohol dehydrogenase-like predicted oxidoreductase
VLLRFARRHSGRLGRRGNFTPEAARASLGTSLRQLRTSYVDVLLLHDCSPEDWADDAIRSLMDELVSDGRVRAYGTATNSAATRAILGHVAHPPSVAQFDWSLSSSGVLLMAMEADAKPIMYSVLSGTLPAVVRALSDDAVRRTWSKALDLELRSREEIANLLLARALRENPRGIVLFSSGDKDRIGENARIAAEAPYDDGQLHLVELLLSSTTGAPTA